MSAESVRTLSALNQKVLCLYCITQTGRTDLWGFLTPPVAGADFLAALVASCFLGACSVLERGNEPYRSELVTAAPFQTLCDFYKKLRPARRQHGSQQNMTCPGQRI